MYFVSALYGSTKTKENNMYRCLVKSARNITSLSIASVLALFASHNALAQFNAVDMVILGPGEVVLGPALGASTLARDEDGVTGTVHVGDLGTNSSRLDRKHTIVYSIWAIVFNNPDECVRSEMICSPGEEGPREGNPSGLSIFWVAGGIASPSIPGIPGTLNVAFRINGPPVGFIIPAFSQDGLTNFSGAEIHFVVAPHPEAMLGNVAFPLTHPAPAIRGAAHMAPIAP
jgi:hypothetical protein